MSYTPSKYWVTLNKRADGMIEKFGYENFKRTVGLFMYNDYFFNHDTGELVGDYEQKVIEVWDKLYSMYPNNILDKLYEPEEGNPFGVVYKGRLVSLDLAASFAEYFMMAQFIKMKSIKVIHEIGAGYGRVPYVIKQIHPDITYRIYDIEPSLSLAKRYLGSVLPDSKIEFHTPDKLDSSCDILIAMNCLHEMTRNHVSDYFDYADKNAGYFYYTCWKKGIVPEEDITWVQSDYPVKEKWVPLYLGQHRMRTEFFEALYKL